MPSIKNGKLTNAKKETILAYINMNFSFVKKTTA